MENKTTKQHGEEMRERILQTIIDYTTLHGYPPSYREIGDMVGLKSTASIYNHLIRMVEEGTLETDHKRSSRAIRVPGYTFKKERKNGN